MFYRKIPVPEFLFNKVGDLTPATFFKKDFESSVFL